jgi:hypothetical protein
MIRVKSGEELVRRCTEQALTTNIRSSGNIWGVRAGKEEERKVSTPISV